MTTAGVRFPRRRTSLISSVPKPSVRRWSTSEQVAAPPGDELEPVGHRRRLAAHRELAVRERKAHPRTHDRVVLDEQNCGFVGRGAPLSPGTKRTSRRHERARQPKRAIGARQPAATIRALRRGLLLLVRLAASSSRLRLRAWARGSVEVVVTLRGAVARRRRDARPRARVGHDARAAGSSSRRRRPSRTCSRSTGSRAPSRRRIARAIPGARVRWRYAITFNGARGRRARGNDLARALARPGIASVWPTARYHASARPHAAADRRAGALGADARDRGPGHEDRRHRRGRRPDASVPLPRRLHDARGIPEGRTPPSRRRR